MKSFDISRNDRGGDKSNRTTVNTLQNPHPQLIILRETRTSRNEPDQADLVQRASLDDPGAAEGLQDGEDSAQPIEESVSSG